MSYFLWNILSYGKFTVKAFKRKGTYLNRLNLITKVLNTMTTIDISLSGIFEGFNHLFITASLNEPTEIYSTFTFK